MMPIEFSCEKCGTMLRRPYTAAGKASTCEACGATTSVPKYSAVPPGPRSATLPPASLVTAEATAPESLPGNTTPMAPPPESPSMAIAPSAITLIAAAARARRSESTAVPESPSESPFDESTDLDNPYRAPTSISTNRQPPPVPSRLTPTSIVAEELFGQAFELFCTRWGRCLAAIWTGQVLIFGGQHVLQQLLEQAQQAQYTPAGVSLLWATLCVVQGMFALWLSCGQTLFMIRIARGEAPSFATIVMGERHFPAALAATLILALGITLVLACFALPVVVAWLALRDPWIVSLIAAPFVLVALVIVTWIGLTFSQALNLIVDRGLGAIEALAVSRQITAGNKLQLFWMGCATLLTPLSVCACGVGLLFGVPYIMLVWALAYVAMIDND